MLSDFKIKFALLKSNCGEEENGFKIGDEEWKIDNFFIKKLKKGFCNLLSYQIAISKIFSMIIIEI